jgi:hypothetical protein
MDDFNVWLSHGYVMGWCGPAVCDTHDGVPMSETELAEFDDGGDPCLHILRLYEDKEHKKTIEESHSPSIWRAINNGL